MSLIGRALIVTHLSLVACSESARDRGVEDTQVVQVSKEREFTFALDTLWQVTSADSGADLSEPAFIAAGSGGIYVTDGVTGIVAFDHGGNRTWSSRDDAQLRSLSSSVAALAVRRGSELVGIDRGGQQLLKIGPNGTAARVVLLEHRWSPNTICVLRDGSVLLAGGDAPLAVVDEHGVERARPAYPWPELRDSSVILQQTVSASGSPNSGCVLAQTFGGGFATTEDGVTFLTHDTRETIPLPAVIASVDSAVGSVTRSERLSNPEQAAIRVAASDSLVVIAFGGTTPRRLGLLDVYHRRSGAYRGSAMVGVPLRGLAASGDSLFVLHDQAGRVVLSALRLLPSSAPPAVSP